jgi:hypothetical protein
MDTFSISSGLLQLEMNLSTAVGCHSLDSCHFVRWKHLCCFSQKPFSGAGSGEKPGSFVLLFSTPPPYPGKLKFLFLLVGQFGKFTSPHGNHVRTGCRVTGRSGCNCLVLMLANDKATAVGVSNVVAHGEPPWEAMNVRSLA